MTKHHDESARTSIAAYVANLESEQIDRGLLDVQQFEALAYFAEHGYVHGARAVARAWIDEDFKALLLRDAPAAFDQCDRSTTDTN